MAARPASLLLAGGRVYRSARDRDPAQALLVEDGRVAWLGASADAPGAERRLDLGGATIIPGLTDAHVHLLAVAQARLQLSFAREPAPHVDAVLTALAGRAGAAPRGEWVMAADLDEGRLAGARLPSRDELDAAVPHHPVLIRRFCGHVAILNSAALRALGIGEGVSDPVGGSFDRQGGRLAGVARERAAEAIFRSLPPPSRAALAASLRAVAADCAGMGLTAATEAAVGFTNGYAEEAEVWEVVRREGGLPLRLGFMLQLDPEEARDRGLAPSSDPLWQTPALKFFADGIVGARTAAMSVPYADRDTTGFFMRPEPELDRVIVEAHRAGWQVAVHAIGDRAIARVIAAFEAAQAGHPRADPRHRIEHFFCPPPDGLGRMKALGAVVVTQPSFLPRMNVSIRAGLGERAHRSYPARSLLDAGVALAGSSDAPTGSLSPWDGIAAAMDRGASAGTAIAAAESLTAREAVALYTDGGAHAMGHEAWRGRLEPGFAADLALLDRDPFAGTAEDLRGTRILLTLRAGEAIHADGCGLSEPSGRG